MPKVVWKSHISPGQTEVNLPRGANPVSVDVQNGHLMMWSIVDSAQPKVPLSIYVAGTGADLPEHIDRFIGTFLIEGGSLVFHVFTLKQ